jgi:YidC/Oxa1 family membrane protein insertase
MWQGFIDGMKFILDNFYFFTASIGFPSYAIAIIIFTIFVRLLLAPFSWKQIVGQRKMREVQPIQAKLQKKYGHNKQVYQQKVMELYKRRKVNPLGGCLPMLLTLPVMFAFYQMLLQKAKQEGGYGYGSESEFFIFELAHTYSFNLLDPKTLILPVLVAAASFFFTKKTMSYAMPKKTVVTDSKGRSKEVEPPSDPMRNQQKVMNFVFSGLMAFIMVVVPSGMALYFITMNAMLFLQTVVINKILDAQQKKKDEIRKDEAVKAGEA